ncbi:clasp N terminal-domain-containing protein [Mycena amicta]|nr:clasp N terminal-domain-containing protein [Mycena amicta]
MASDDSRLEVLINQCRSNDVDVKVDALAKLQAEFESAIEINDPEGLIQVLKACLRTSNQHLTTATLSALPPLLPLLIAPALGNEHLSTSSINSTPPSSVVDSVTLRQVLVAFLPAGGLIERLGDKERAQVKAREALIILGGFAFRSGASSSIASNLSKGAKGPETPLMIFERHLRELGFASKVWKVREQALLALVHIRRAYPQFPIRAYLPQLVDALEDTDAHVRDCARQSVVELFSGPGVSDGARADLKKEMTKKNVRKTIVDGVLSKLLGLGGGSNPQSREGSEDGDTTMKPKDYVPPSLALAGRRPTNASSTSGPSRTASTHSTNISRPPSRAAAVESPSGAATPTTEGSESVKPVYIASSRDLENEFAAMHKPFEGKETEHNWADRDRAVLRVRGMVKGEVHLRFTEAFMAGMKEFIPMSLKTLASLRTTVAVSTCSLYTELALALGPALDPFCDVLFTHLLKMAGFTKKLTAQQSQAALSLLIEHTSAPPRILLPLLWACFQEKTVQTRSYAVMHLKQYLELHGQRSKHAIESSGGLDILEKSLKRSLGDANPVVKESTRVCFWVFDSIWRERGLVILGGLDAMARKQLEKACPDPNVAAEVLPPTTPKATKKTSVAAAIAASRAKAKAIATAPPTLRHQATSTSHSGPVRRANSPGVSPRNSMVARPASPLRMSTSASTPSSSSPPQKSRIVSNGISRSISAEAVTTSNSGPSAPSSPSEQSFRRRTSSPLVSGAINPNRTSTIRKTMRTTLPSSPGSSLDPASPSPRNGVSRNTAVPVNVRQSLFSHPSLDDESLLLAQTVPIPHSDSDSESMDQNLLSFSAAFEKFGSPAPRKTNSQMSPEVSNALSSGSMETNGGQPVVEDALRARAEQAESAAERLLELVDPDDENVHHSTIPSSLHVGTNAQSVKPKAKPTPLPISQIHTKAPFTPLNKTSAIMRQAALFKNSPAYGGQSSASLMDVLQDQRHQTGWWLKRKNLVAQGTPLRPVGEVDRVQELQGYIEALEGDGDVHTLQKVALLAIENPVTDTVPSPLSPEFGFPSSPSPFVNASRSLPSLHADMWSKNKNFDRLFNALLAYLQPSKSEEELEYGLIALWELLENQAVYVEGREGDVFSLLLRMRYCAHHSVLEATNTVRDMLATRIEPVYGLTTMHASLRAFNAEACPAGSTEEAKAATYAFGLIALGKFTLRLPAEIAEEELPRLKGTLISALNDKSSLVIRESAAAAIIAAQLALRDETHLFMLLDGLADEKKNLLTYLFDKHGARGAGASTGPSRLDKLEKEMRRLDTRTSTPPRPQT